MQVSEVKLKRESEREIFFAHYPLGGLIIGAVGVGFGYLPTYFGAGGVTRWIFAGAGAFFAIVGVLGALWRYELYLDLVSRTYSRRRGFWPSPKKITGSLDDLNAVVLSQEWSRSTASKSGSTEFPWWKISLDFKGWEKTVSIEALRSERQGHERLEYYAKKLKTWAVDRTGSQEQKRNWDELDLPLAGRSGKQLSAVRETSAVDPSIPPLGSRIRVTGYPGKRDIILPHVGWNSALVFLSLFGVVFAGFGAFFMLAKSGLYTELTGRAITVTESSPGAGWIVSSVFVLVGVGIAMLGIIASYSTEQLQELGGELIWKFRFLGWSLRSRRVPKTEIEEIELRDDITPRSGSRSSVKIGNYSFGTARRDTSTRAREVFVRSDKQIFRMGRHLSEAEREWLQGALIQIVRSQS